MKRTILFILVCVMAITAFAGCAAPAAAPASESTAAADAATTEADAPKADEASSGEQIKLTYLETQPTESKTAQVKAMIDKFMEENPNITVEFVSIPNDQATEKLINLAAANQLPDVVEMNDSWLAPLASSGHLEDMQPYFDKWDQKENIVPAAVELGAVIDNKLYYIPYGLWGSAVYYNKELLDSTGMEPPVTQEDFYNVAKAITEKNEGKYGFAFRGGMYGMPQALGWMLGGAGTPYLIDPETGKSTLNTPEAIAGLKNYLALYEDGFAPKDSLTWAFRECVEGFTTGSTGMLIQSNEVVQICNEKMGEGTFDTTMLPIGASGKGYDAGGQTGYAMSANSANKDAAWALLSYLLDPEVSKEYVISMGFTPINTILADDPAFSTGPIKVYLDQIMSDTVEFAKVPSYLPEWSGFVGEWGAGEIQKTLLGEQTAEELAANLAKYLEDAEATYRAG